MTRSPHSRPHRTTAICVLLFSALSMLGGCSLNPVKWVPSMMSSFAGAGGEMTLSSTNDDSITLRGDFGTGVYTNVDRNTATVVLFEGDPASPSQVLTIRMLWNPYAGRTPVDATATNATIQYIIFAGDEVGIYSGAGYLYPSNDLDGNTFSAGIWQSTLRLADKTEGFVDRLGPAQMEGKFNVKRDELTLDQTMHRLNVLIRQKLGRSRLVGNDGEASLAGGP